MDMRQEHDPSPIDFDLETELALESLQQQVRNKTIHPHAADQYMRKIFSAYYYDNFSELDTNGKVIIVDGTTE